ncbi:hypothetical protein EW145_g2058 [Phellinidium pouzarii]|uniref:Uncharacterized protein n=1 Tax=Phellinidium pouzarii TaxID=167371 RepID=A0A4V3XDE3_9AGAM|nr:hypothetical protein EW145_g2058 [Phellinidium pouzarii]
MPHQHHLPGACSWPDPVPAKKKTPAHKNLTVQRRPSSAGSQISDTSSTPRAITPNAQDMSASLGVTSVSDSGRRHDEAQAYSYADANIAMNRRQTNGSHNHLPHSIPPSMNSVQDLPPSYTTTMTSSYGFNHSPDGSISSRGNSRPSTANSMPSSRFSGVGLEGNHYDTSPALPSMDGRDYPRWETLPHPRSDSNSYNYHPPQANSIMVRHYSHEHGNRM